MTREMETLNSSLNLLLIIFLLSVSLLGISELFLLEDSDILVNETITLNTLGGVDSTFLPQSLPVIALLVGFIFYNFLFYGFYYFFERSLHEKSVTAFQNQYKENIKYRLFRRGHKIVYGLFLLLATSVILKYHIFLVSTIWLVYVAANIFSFFTYNIFSFGFLSIGLFAILIVICSLFVKFIVNEGAITFFNFNISERTVNKKKEAKEIVFDAWNFNGAVFEKSTFNKVVFKNKDTSLKGVLFSEVIFEKCKFHEINFEMGNIAQDHGRSPIKFNNCTIEGGQMKNLNLNYVSFLNSRFRKKVDVEGASFQRTSFTGSDLYGLKNLRLDSICGIARQDTTLLKVIWPEDLITEIQRRCKNGKGYCKYILSGNGQPRYKDIVKSCE